MLKVILSMSNTGMVLILGGFLIPVLMIPDFTAQMIAFIFMVSFLCWYFSIPSIGRRDDGTLYELDGYERAEWVRQNGYFED